VVTPLDPTPTDHWNAVYRRRKPTVLPENDRVANAALAHFGSVEGCRILDLGCGTGEYSRFFAAHGAQVIAVDRSEVAVNDLRESCAADGVTTVEPVVGNAFGLGALGEFDFVFGSMILHHIEPFDQFVDVLAGALGAGGRGFFYENSAMSRFLVWCRAHLVGRFGIPKHSDHDEFPLQPQEIDLLRRRFDVEVDQPELLLTRLASGYLLRGHADHQLGWLDGQLYRIERLRPLSYLQYVRLIAPI
jgi:2-polyprenyl-3-methyl-5-hydroxy-6-metoxy-1,4-benzoquinol methylase